MIDTHQHFWRYTTEDFGWISDDMSAIRRDYLPQDLHPILKQNNFTATIAVQARQSEEETRWLLDLAAQYSFIAAVVGWLPLASPHIASKLDEFAHAKLRGLRHVLQGEPDAFMQREDFNAGLRALQQRNLVYELLVFEHQLPAAAALVDRHPNLQFVLDHLAKPNLDRQDREPWRANLRELARRPNVICKLSGGITEADLRWTAAKLIPYFDDALAAFGPTRLLFGSNWPVCDSAGGYATWLTAVQNWAECLSPNEQHDFFTATAGRIYKVT